MHHEALRDKLP